MVLYKMVRFAVDTSSALLQPNRSNYRRLKHMVSDWQSERMEGLFFEVRVGDGGTFCQKRLLRCLLMA